MRCSRRLAAIALLVAVPGHAAGHAAAPPRAGAAVAGQAGSFAAISPTGRRSGDLLLRAFLVSNGLASALLLAGLLAARRSRRRMATDNAALSEAVAVLREELKTRTEFLATTSHEIRTPLNGILGMTQVLLADHRVDAWLRDRIDVVHGAGEAMKAMVDEILDFAKSETGNLTLEHITVDIGRMLEEAERLWRPQAEAKGLSLELDLGGCPRLIEGDPLRLRQILFNLMSNAVKFTDEGAVALTASTEQGGTAEQLVIRIRDSGIGIAEDQQSLVFEKFRQADRSIARRFGGTGLGLALCRSFAEAMGGQVTVASRPGRGSTFTVSLPLRRVDPVKLSDTVSVQQRADRLGDARVLVVEVNALTQRIMCNMIEPAVSAVEVAASAGDAVKRLGAGTIDHVVADALAGGEDPDAVEALARLAATAASAGARMTLLFAPALAAEAAQVTARHASVQAVAKPVTAPALLRELRRLYPAAEAPAPAAAASAR